MPTIGTTRIATTKQKESWSRFENDAPDMVWFGHEVGGCARLDFKVKGAQPRDFCGQSWRLFFSLTALFEPTAYVVFSSRVVQWTSSSSAWLVISVKHGRLRTRDYPFKIRIAFASGGRLIGFIDTALGAFGGLVTLPFLAIFLFVAFAGRTSHTRSPFERNLRVVKSRTSA